MTDSNPYERQVQAFMKNIMANQGFYVKIPVSLKNKELIKPGEFTEEEKQIWTQTSELLEMMGITYETNLQSLSIMVRPVEEQ